MFISRCVFVIAVTQWYLIPHIQCPPSDPIRFPQPVHHISLDAFRAVRDAFIKSSMQKECISASMNIVELLSPWVQFICN